MRYRICAKRLGNISSITNQIKRFTTNLNYGSNPPLKYFDRNKMIFKISFHLKNIDNSLDNVLCLNIPEMSK